MLARLAILGLILLLARAAGAQSVIRDDFEGPEISLRDPASDANYTLEVHRRVQQSPHAGRWCEQLTVRGNNGTYIYLGRPIGRARVIGELAASIWVKADRPGLQFLAHVVLPRSKDPNSGRPLTTLVRGSDYRQVGTWRQLRIENIPKQLEGQIRVLRSRFGPDVDAREAYVDRLLLNVYGGPGVTNVWVDDLEVAGAISAGPPADDSALNDSNLSGPVLPLPDRAPGAAPRLATSTPSRVRNGAARPGSAAQIEFKNPLLLVDGKPFFLRSIDYQGEPLARLKSLGFNAVRIANPLTADLLAEAADAGLWLIAPPPPARALESLSGQSRGAAIGAEFDSVLAWCLGSGLAKSELDATKHWAKLVQAADPRKRPIVCDADSDLRDYTRPPMQLFIARRDPIGTTFGLDQYAAWLRERSQLVIPGTPLWVTMQTEPAQRLAEQMTLLADRRTAPNPLQDSQLRTLVRTALAAGARGLCFESHARLDGQDPAAKRRALLLELMNLELELIERWPAAGNLAPGAVSSVAQVQGAVLETDRSRLLLPIYALAGNQFVMGNPASKLTFRVAGVPEGNDAYELSLTSFRRVASLRMTGGTQVILGDERRSGTTGEDERDSMIVYTQDERVIQNLRKRVDKIAPRAAQLTVELAKTEFQHVETIEQQLIEIGRAIPATKRLRGETEKELQQCDELLKSSRDAAYYRARHVLQNLRDIERAHWDKAQSPTASPLADPFVAGFATLAEHYRFAYEMTMAPRGPNRLAEGDFENIDAMLHAGWKYYQHLQMPPNATAPPITTSVEVSSHAAHSGRTGLVLRAAPTDPKSTPSIVETPPLWITSAPVRVARGDLVQISGWLRIDKPLFASADGLLILDTFSGEALAYRINTSPTWRQFTLYRAAPYSGQLAVTFALAGLGEVCLDDITLQVVQRKPAAQSPQAQSTRLPTAKPGS